MRSLEASSLMTDLERIGFKSNIFPDSSLPSTVVEIMFSFLFKPGVLPWLVIPERHWQYFLIGNPWIVHMWSKKNFLSQGWRKKLPGNLIGDRNKTWLLQQLPRVWHLADGLEDAGFGQAWTDQIAQIQLLHGCWKPGRKPGPVGMTCERNFRIDQELHIFIVAPEYIKSQLSSITCERIVGWQTYLGWKMSPFA